MATLVYKCDKCKIEKEFITSISQDKNDLANFELLGYKCGCGGTFVKQVTAPRKIFFGKPFPD